MIDRRRNLTIGVLTGCLLAVNAVAPVYGQTLASPADATNAPVAATTANQPADRSGASSFLHDVGHDYVNFLSKDNAQWAAVGGTLTLTFYQLDHQLEPDTASNAKVGSTYGNLAFQVPLAVTWWIAGHAIGNAHASEAGRDLLRAQISALSWTYAIKYAVQRTRPNGDPRSFPSGHASASFATAAVLQQQYGWKLGVPMFAIATYTGIERVRTEKHWPSDVAAGALVGVLAGRTVTVRLRGHAASVSPLPVPGGAGVLIHVFP